MILLAHMLFGAAIGTQISNPYFTIILAFLGHYFLDLFPHIEYSIDKIKDKNWEKSLPDISKVILDFVFGILIIFTFSRNQAIVYLCAFVALIPDALTIISSIFPNRILAQHDEIHTQKIHYFKYKKTRALNKLSARPSTKNFIFSALVSIPFRILTQALVIIISIMLLKI